MGEASSSRGEKTVPLAQLDVHKQAGQWARLYKQAGGAEARLRQAERETSPSLAESPEDTKQAEGHSSAGEMSPQVAEGPETDEQQERLRAIASEVVSWQGGLNVLQRARLPTWRGVCKWQIEAKIAALQAEYATLCTEVAKPDG